MFLDTIMKTFQNSEFLGSIKKLDSGDQCQLKDRNKPVNTLRQRPGDEAKEASQQLRHLIFTLCLACIHLLKLWSPTEKKKKSDHHSMSRGHTGVVPQIRTWYHFLSFLASDLWPNMFTGGTHTFLLHFPLFALLHPGLCQRSPMLLPARRQHSALTPAVIPPVALWLHAGRTLGIARLLNYITLPGTERGAEIFQCSVMKPNPFNLLPKSCPPISNLPHITLFHIFHPSYFSISSCVIKKKKYDAECCGRTWVWKISAISSKSWPRFHPLNFLKMQKKNPKYD